MAKSTLQDLINCPRDFLTPQQVGDVLGCDPQNLRIMARQRPDLMRFEFQIVGNRVKFPKRQFLRYMGVRV
nr:MAG TPA: excisionase [Caudoviricetes sp.]